MGARRHTRAAIIVLGAGVFLLLVNLAACVLFVVITYLPLDSIAAVSIGGASLSGGVGTVAGTFIGVIILSVLNNIMNLLGVPPTLQPAIKGVVILKKQPGRRKSVKYYVDQEKH